jgi:hypothetical protein
VIRNLIRARRNQSIYLSTHCHARFEAAVSAGAAKGRPSAHCIGRKPLLLTFGFLGTLFTYPLLVTLHHTSSSLMAFMLIVAGWVIVSGA